MSEDNIWIVSDKVSKVTYLDMHDHYRLAHVVAAESQFHLKFPRTSDYLHR